MNMWCLWQMGALCESLYGRWTYAAIYLLTGIAGGLATLAWHPGVPSVGASGALFGLTGALIASFYLGEFSLSGIHIRGALTSLLFFAGFSLFFGSVFPGIDNACHVGGLVSGLILGALIARLAPDANNPLRRGGVLLFVALLVAASAFGIQRWRTYPMRSMITAQQSVNQMIAELRKRVKEHPQDASAHNALAHELFVMGEYSEGEEELKRVLELEPNNTDARMDLGATYLNQQQPKEAQEQFATLVGQDPNDAEAYVGLAMALADQQQHKSAVEEYQTALKLDPQLKGVYYQLGVSQLKLKQYDEAIASYLKEREQNGDDIALEMALAEAYDAKGSKPQADEARSKAAALKNGQHD